MRLFYWLVNIILTYTFFCQIALAETVIHHNKITSAKESYQLSLLKLALSYSETNYTFSESKHFLSQNKLLNDLAQDKVNVAWVGTSSEYEQEFSAIRIPLFKGLLGYRIFLIREDKQDEFDQVKTLNQLAQLQAGQVTSWTDAKILSQAGLDVVTTNKYPNLFYMLEGGRFDYLPRSVYSPWAEMASHPELPLAVEKNLMIVYTLPAYFFVNKNNHKLKDDIYSGLLNAIEDGSFDRFFYSHPLIKEGLEQSKISNRKIFFIENPFLPPLTPTEDKRLWFDVGAYAQ
ncbi:transporter substrate-binding domain-containing protein [Gayadomonas joobiniege]|uniref:transporter substrate-binding domain-containing protein n=1 Tax=Gayadomonas joobiniege TaxID=1234606 RepID=UPI0003685D77|nr:transporter substrate-binding domain-containing protein [Gayadomonas joobiniege]